MDNITFIYKCIEEYDKKTSLEVQNELVPIIKSFKKSFLEDYIGISKSYLYRICKNLYVRNNEKPNFDVYIRIKMLEENYSLIEPREHKQNIKREDGRKVTVVIESCENEKYHVDMEVTTRGNNQVYVVQVCPRFNENMCGYPLNQRTYSVNDKKNAYATYKRYVKKYIEGK